MGRPLYDLWLPPCMVEKYNSRPMPRAGGLQFDHLGNSSSETFCDTHLSTLLYQAEMESTVGYMISSSSSGYDHALDLDHFFDFTGSDPEPPRSPVSSSPTSPLLAGHLMLIKHSLHLPSQTMVALQDPKSIPVPRPTTSPADKHNHQQNPSPSENERIGTRTLHLASSR
jgi:hypothetical protein